MDGDLDLSKILSVLPYKRGGITTLVEAGLFDIGEVMVKPVTTEVAVR